MKHIVIAGSLVMLLAACSDSGNKQSDPIDNTPPPQAGNTAPTDRDPTPQSGTGGESHATTPTGNTNNAPAATPGTTPGTTQGTKP